MQNKNYIIATIRPWNIENFKKHLGGKKNFFLIQNKSELVMPHLKKLDPRYIFFPHWSWIIPEEILKNFKCIIFHCTDLPYGRGGSPIQNLIVRGFTKTKISALSATKNIDAGEVYLRRPLSLKGSAKAIFKRMSKKIFTDMIPHIIKYEPMPKAQKGKVTQFQRREPKDSNIASLKSLSFLYDYIRMLDAPGYPKAYIETSKFRIEFSKAKQIGNRLLTQADIYEK